jgi:hypothetical protein
MDYKSYIIIIRRHITHWVFKQDLFYKIQNARIPDLCEFNIEYMSYKGDDTITERQLQYIIIIIPGPSYYDTRWVLI